MNGFFKFSLWVVLAGLAIKLCGSTGFALTIAGGIAFLFATWFLGRMDIKEEREPDKFELNPKLYSVSSVDEPDKLLTEPELENAISVQVRYQKNLETLIGVLCFAAVICMAVSVYYFNGNMLAIFGLTGALLALLGKCNHKYANHKIAGYTLEMEKKRDLYLSLYPRPKLDLNNPESLKLFCSHFETLVEAEIAANIAKAIGVGFMIYPGDSMRMVCGSQYQEIIEKYYYNFRETLLDTVRNISNLQIIPAEQLPEPLDPVPPSPQVSESTERAAFTLKKFCSYWPTREEAATALAVRYHIIALACTGFNEMYYPNDSLSDIADDITELIIAIREQFEIDDPIKDAGKMDDKFTFADFVHYILKKQEKKKYENS